MTDPGTPQKPMTRARLKWLVLLSRIVLFLEEVTVRFWQPAVLIAAFVALAATGWIPQFGPWAHTVLLAAFLAAIIWRATVGYRRFVQPGEADGRRRLERLNALRNRPLETLEDTMAGNSPGQLALWEAHKRRLRETLGPLRIGGMAPRLTGRDPYAIRFSVLLALIAALVAAGPRTPDRLAEALLPAFARPAPAIPVAIDAWITPPAYTGQPPVFLNSGGTIASAEDTAANEGETESTDRIAVPVGSEIVVQVSGVEGPVTLDLAGDRIEAEPFAAGAQRFAADIEKSGTATLTAGTEVLAGWAVTAVPDTPPTIEATQKPRPTPQLSLAIFYAASDDYALHGITAEFRRADAPPTFDGKERLISTPLPVPPPQAHGLERRGFRDLTSHPWAGGAVDMVLVATDNAGQQAKSEPIRLLLPERTFQHPVARAIIAQRRTLAWDTERNRETVRDALRDIAGQHQAYGDDIVVFMALDMAARRLARLKTGWAPGDEEIRFVIDILWKTALRLEDGGVSLALARLREAERALAEALAEGAEMAELDRLMRELQSAMNDYLNALQEEMARNMKNGDVPEIEQDANTRIMQPDDLNAMLDQLRELMQSGMREEAMEMLAQLQQLMENMRAGVTSQMSQAAREGMEMLNEMGDLMSSQRDLLDRTFKRSQQPGQGQHGEWSREGLEGNGQLGGDMPMPDAQAQEALRRRLGDLMRRYGEMMGDIPPPFGRAEGEMRGAEDALRGGDPSGAVQPQTRAMDQLQAAAEAARDAIMERFAQEMSPGQQMPGQGGQSGLDPLGREPNANYRGPSQGEVEIPDQGTIERAREVRDELRKRSGQRQRPPRELDYIDRLLDQFQ